MNRKCPNCGSSEIDDDSARGDSTCMGCGTVLEESTIVSDVAFQENSGGGHSLVGQFISKERGQPTNLSGVPGLSHQESREITYYKGKKLIEEIASQLRINQHCVNTAFNFFKMCVSRNFTRGRVRSHVVAACLYMTCRLENTAHLLLDFSDITQVVSLATRLIQRMKRDWIATGRRPTGLCGAALLLAARCYNFNRTVADVVRVVHISEAVVKKRLDEFGQTPSSTLTIDEFTSVDLERCEDPPAFRESRRKAREMQLQKEEEALRKIELERFKRTQYARMMSGSLGSESDELTPADAVVRNEIVDLVFSAARSTVPCKSDAGMSSTYAPSLVSLGITPFRNETELTGEAKSEKLSSNGELDLEGIDDDEIDTYILTKEEEHSTNHHWNEKFFLLSTLATSDLLNFPDIFVREISIQALLLEGKKLSNKINYDILKEIEDTDETVIKAEIDCSASDAKEETCEVSDRTLFKDNKSLKLTTGKLLKARKRFRPNVNLATKKTVEQTISVIAASDTVQKESVKDLSMDEDDTLFPSEMKTNKSATIQNQASSSNTSAAITEANVSSTEMEYCNLQSKTDGLDSFQAGSSDLTASFPGKIDRLMRKRKLTKSSVKENSESIDINSKNTTVTKVVGNNLSEKPRMIKRRYAKMQPNLKSVQKFDKPIDQDDQQSSLATVSDVLRDVSVESKIGQQGNEDTEVSLASENSKIEAVGVGDVAKNQRRKMPVSSILQKRKRTRLLQLEKQEVRI
ncbi:hypothetical protein DINM_022417 [Dirofilaria immitis]|nr:hypothetical protein [Dirofilaria immitis]